MELIEDHGRNRCVSRPVRDLVSMAIFSWDLLLVPTALPLLRRFFSPILIAVSGINIGKL
jgi:hypothetical protein